MVEVQYIKYAHLAAYILVSLTEQLHMLTVLVQVQAITNIPAPCSVQQRYTRDFADIYTQSPSPRAVGVFINKFQVTGV